MTVAEETVAWLGQHGIRLSDPMDLKELLAIEREHQFEFGPYHRELLLTAVPIGKGWMDWRTSDAEFVRWKLS